MAFRNLRPADDRRGMVNVWVAVMVLALIGFTGLACDVAHYLVTAHQLQNGADAAALAGARQLMIDPTTARQAAVELAGANAAALAAILLDPNVTNDPAGDVVVGAYDFDLREFTPTERGANAVQVTARRTEGSLGGPLPTLFAKVFGVQTVNIERTAIAVGGDEVGAGLIVLCDDCRCALRFKGSNEFVVRNGTDVEGEVTIQVNSDDPCSTCGSGSSMTLEADVLRMTGDSCWNGSPTLNVEERPYRTPVPDPLAELPDPLWDPAADLGGIMTSGTYEPGYYSEGLRLTATGDLVTLEPGVYVLDGQGLQVNGGNMIAEGVMFYIIGSGQTYLGGSGLMRITPAVDGPYRDISLFQARDNENLARIIGGSNMDLQGTYYFPLAEVELGGNGISVGNQIIAWELLVHGTGVFNIDYHGAFPTPGYEVFLVR